MSRALRGGLSLPGPGEERRRRQGLPVPRRASGRDSPPPPPPPPPPSSAPPPAALMHWPRPTGPPALAGSKGSSLSPLTLPRPGADSGLLCRRRRRQEKEGKGRGGGGTILLKEPRARFSSGSPSAAHSGRHVQAVAAAPATSVVWGEVAYSEPGVLATDLRKATARGRSSGWTTNPIPKQRTDQLSSAGSWGGVVGDSLGWTE